MPETQTMEHSSGELLQLNQRPQIARKVKKPCSNEIPAVPTRAEIARLANIFWIGQGCRSDNDLEHWYRAEETLKHCSWK